MFSGTNSLTNICKLTIIFCLSISLGSGWASAAAADTESYYAPPTNISSGLQISYSDKFSQDYINLNTNAFARFSNATSAFHFNKEKRTITNLRASIAAGSVSSPDKDLTWILIARTALSINEFEEIVLFSTQPATFGADHTTTLEGYMTLRGITGPVKIQARLHFVDGGNILFGEKGSIGMSLNINFLCSDFGMAPVDSNNKSRGDLGALRIDMRAIRQ